MIKEVYNSDKRIVDAEINEYSNPKKTFRALNLYFHHVQECTVRHTNLKDGTIVKTIVAEKIVDGIRHQVEIALFFNKDDSLATL